MRDFKLFNTVVTVTKIQRERGRFWGVGHRRCITWQVGVIHIRPVRKGHVEHNCLASQDRNCLGILKAQFKERVL